MTTTFHFDVKLVISLDKAGSYSEIRYFLHRMLFEVNGLSKRFGRIQALSAVCFQVRKGEVLGLIGPNGAGKSTLFECLAGMMPFDGGCVTAAGRPVNSRNRHSLLFYVPDGITPWPRQSVRWALDFTVGFLGGHSTARDEVIEQTQLKTFLDQPFETLSKGQRKRALLAIGLLTRQPALLIDEPFDGLDLRQTREIGDVFREHARRGRTLFLSIHQISDAERICHRFVLLSGGKVCGAGTVAELARNAAAAGLSKSDAQLEEVFLALV